MVRLGQDHQVSPACPGGQRGCCERVSLEPQKPFFLEVQRVDAPQAGARERVKGVPQGGVDGEGGGRNLDDQAQAG